MAASKKHLGDSFGGLREATCKGNWPFEAYAKRMGVCVFMRVGVWVCMASFPLKHGDEDGSFHS